jgi:hypothetical protein
VSELVVADLLVLAEARGISASTGTVSSDPELRQQFAEKLSKMAKDDSYNGVLKASLNHKGFKFVERDMKESIAKLVKENGPRVSASRVMAAFDKVKSGDRFVQTHCDEFKVSLKAFAGSFMQPECTKEHGQYLKKVVASIANSSTELVVRFRSVISSAFESMISMRHELGCREDFEVPLHTMRTSAKQFINLHLAEEISETYLHKLATRQFDIEETNKAMHAYIGALSSLKTLDIIAATAAQIFDSFTFHGERSGDDIRMLIADYSNFEKACEAVDMQDKLVNFKKAFSMKDVVSPQFSSADASMKARLYDS